MEDLTFLDLGVLTC